MSFDEILKKIVTPCTGSLGAALMGSDGIPIAQVTTPSAGSDAEDEVSILSVELGRILAETQKASDSSGTGVLEEVTVQMERATAILRRVDEETYLVVVLGPEANAGRARFDIRRRLLELREQL
jgi:predicted regulator of Ras-like GTPase activity (Roadblock/LC7/MglB family)